MHKESYVQRTCLLFRDHTSEFFTNYTVLHFELVIFLCGSMKNVHQRLLLQQGISFTGADLPRFQDAITGIRIIESILSQEFQENQFQPYQPSNYLTFPSIDASNRYFSFRRDVSASNHLDIHPTIDPAGLLKSMQGETLVHAADNIVEYYKANNNLYAIYKFNHVYGY